MSIHWSRMPYDQELLPDLTWVTSEELQEKAWLAEEAQSEAERQEQAQLEEERAHTEAEVQRLEAVHKAEEARKEAESQWADALWLVEGEASSGVGLAGDKGKRKADVTSPWTREKKKRSRQPSAKVLEGAGDEDDTSDEVEASPVTGDQMECLIKAVECIADNMGGLAMAQREVSQNFYWFTQSYETYIEECFEFLAPDVPSDQNTTDEEDRDIEGLDDELEGLREEEEGSWSQSESGDQAGASSAGSQV
ncbi:hypothetical protein M404DRAFT_21755 [Pisolithus tinctorius Marx 270]|uniref:Uncharacterized protein n=1 Tax=Pisolithus tinctorius Marx 270 TaxID=870435 RepID=A0A0C3KKG0_PISTI|nr:hypothetical protein M404DRAFT_21755 [Pisolithus tinctorius Marx 270]